MSEGEGYKVFDLNWKSENDQYYMGQIHKCGSKKKGIEYYSRAVDCLATKKILKKDSCKYAKVRAKGMITEIGGVYLTNELELVEEISYEEFMSMCTGQVIKYHNNKVLAMKCDYVKGVQDGTLIEWFASGHKKLHAEYKMGVKHGIYTKWYPNGQKKLEDNYYDGLQHGMDREWFESGKIKLESQSEMGIKQGDAKQWSENGDRI
jgi:antitoxin component YwqK of YwqJK toxin-antitoxin module